jgi:hypothetical protein
MEVYKKTNITDIIQDAGHFHELAREMQRGAKKKNVLN